MSRPNARQLDAIRWLPCTSLVASNASPIPAFGCVQIVGTLVTGGIASLQVTQPTDSSGPFAFNGTFPIPCCAGGSCTQDYPCVALYDAGTPAIGETWIPLAGQYALAKGEPGAAGGFIVEGVIDGVNRTMWVAPGMPTSLASAATTTTSAPSLPAIALCAGTCRWVWSADNNAWSLGAGEDNCSTPTTTSISTSSTTSTTGDPSTTTTPNPCPCNTTTTDDPAASKTTSTSTTSSPCRCISPTYCGSTDGECTTTYCAGGAVTPLVSCTTSTTTSSTSSTTSTTQAGCDCATSTTACPGVSFVYTPTGWVPSSRNCCPYGVTVPSTAANPCDTTDNVPCNETTLPPAPCSPYCFGWCLWYWINSTWHGGGAPDCCNYGCDSDCQSLPPSFDGTICGQIVATQCQQSNTTTSTTTAASLPPVGQPGSCPQCYSTSSTSTSSTTTSTTTTGPCTQGCIYAASGSSWSQTFDGCDGVTCGCASPPNPPSGECDVETAQAPCVPLTTTTSTTTSTTSTTTTTCGPCPSDAGSAAIDAWVACNYPFHDDSNVIDDPAYPGYEVLVSDGSTWLLGGVSTYCVDSEAAGGIAFGDWCAENGLDISVPCTTCVATCNTTTTAAP